MFHNDKYFLGCPIWNCAAWRGAVYPVAAPRESWLGHYSKCFNAVEGNSTFYGLPNVETIGKWADQTPAGFRFVLKFPRVITHEKQLVGAEEETRTFLQRMEPLKAARRLGPLLLQLPPTLGPASFDSLKRYVDGLPADWPLAVEVRHPEWYLLPAEEEWESWLSAKGIDRVVFDTRPLFAATPKDESEREAQRRKPRLPLRTRPTGRHPILRFVGRNATDAAAPWIEEWAEVLSVWMDNGLQPYVFTHSPDDRFAPQLARLFHQRLTNQVKGLEAAEPWPYRNAIQPTLF